MDKLLSRLNGNAKLLSSIQKCETQITPILNGFVTNFPDFTDHSISHSKTVLRYAELLLAEKLESLNEDEIYVLIMAGFLHDIGMCPTPKMKKEVIASSEFQESGKSFEDYLREVHHEVTYQYISTHWEKLHIINEAYSEAIALVGMGHRVIDLLDFKKYSPEFPVKSGTDFVCLPYLAGILRLADELDITNDRTPELLYNEYLPTNRISKKEWDKHKANYFVNFRTNTIRITSKTFEKDLYFALLRQYAKIDDVLKYVQKVVTTLPLNERGLKLDFVKLERNVQTVGFVPKEIGFSFDLQNTIDTFIGHNIYNDKFIAIRECLQNAIDTCRFKKQLSKGQYLPEIQVTLSDQLLRISDNGLGMDDFIIANYFSKLAKSYYTERRVSSEYEAISQFGIGVFSYFLFCDFFEVETKQEGKPSMKFRVTKDADSYFYFYDDSQKETTGTTISLHLSERVSFDNLVERIRFYIRFVEIPIKVTYAERVESITGDEFVIDKFKLRNRHVDRRKLEALQKLEVIEAKISNDDCEGILGLLIPMNQQGTYVPVLKYATLDTSDASRIELAHKGIFLSSLDHGALKNVIGMINLKRRFQLNLARNHVRQFHLLQEATGPFYREILTKLFENWKHKTAQEKVELTTNFLKYYLNRDVSGNYDLVSLFTSSLYFSVYNGGEIEHYSLKEILDYDTICIVNGEIPLTSDHIYDYHNIDEIYQQLKRPLVLQNQAEAASILYSIFKARKNYIEMKCTKKHWYFLIKPRITIQEYPVILTGRYEAYSFDKPHICAYPALFLERPFNTNHPILIHYEANAKSILEEQRLFSRFNKFFRALESFIFEVHSVSRPMRDATSEVIYINSLLEEINELQRTSFKLTEEDFPNWINQKINW